MIRFLVVCFALLVGGVLVAPRVSRRADLMVSRIALSAFGGYVADDSPRKTGQQQLMRAAHTGDTHRVYASRTLLYAGVLGVAGSVFGVFLAASALTRMEVRGDVIRERLPSALGFLADLTQLSAVSLLELFGLLVFASATVGSVLALGTYYLRWKFLDQRAVARASQIEATLPRTVAFVYALSRSGMAFPKVMDTLARNEAVYGEAATELSVAVRDMDAFGTDVLTALQHTADRTPSENMEEFSENLASVLGSGRSISEFLHDQYERFQKEAEAQQQQYLELLSTFAEAYVTVLVAGPLFFITILVVVGLVIEDTLPLLRVVVYAGIPLASLAFIVYVDSVTQTLQSPGEIPHRSDLVEDGEFSISDGGVVSPQWQADRERLAAYDRFQTLLEWTERPVDLLLRRPSVTFLLTIPIGIAWVAIAAWPISFDSWLSVLTAVDVALVQATIGAAAVYGLFYEIRKRKTTRIEASVPDFLDRLASTNEAGMTVVESVRRVTDTDLGELTPELQRTWRDIQWGSDVESALRRMDDRVESPLVGRSVALIVNAMEASGEIGPVLHIASDEARASRQLRRERRQTMATYLIVIYISFSVFIGIIAALTVSFIPAIEQAVVTNGSANGAASGASGGITGGIGEISVGAYETLFFHASVVQAFCSGLIAGQLGEGTIRDGVKHVVILLSITFVSFVLMGLI